jgi:hypothetical protein
MSAFTKLQQNRDSFGLYLGQPLYQAGSHRSVCTVQGMTPRRLFLLFHGDLYVQRVWFGLNCLSKLGLTTERPRPQRRRCIVRKH